MKKTAFTLAAMLILGTSFSQKTAPCKFGKVSVEDLQKTVYALDSNANAVVIADVGESSIEGNTKGWFSLQFTHYKRVHVLKKSGYSIAEVSIPLYVRGTEEERINSIKAVTYNLENGKVVESPLDKAGIFTDKLDKYHLVKKFTFPNVKEGSIIEFKYTLTSDFLFNLRPWEFQGTAPRLWSEYTVTVPGFLGYMFFKKGYQQFFINESKEEQKMFHITESGGTGASENYTFTSGVINSRWVMKDVPELKKESFTSTLDNHLSSIEFQLAEYKQPLTPKQVIQSWPQVAKELLNDEDFGKNLSTNNNWMSDEEKAALGNASTNLEKAQRIFAYVRDNISCTSHHAFYASQSLKNVLRSKKGNVADINLLLAAMLRYAGILANPVLLSTRENGYAYALYPILSQYNYVACSADIDGNRYLLDASMPKLGFGRLPSDCYNGTARLISEMPTALELRPDSLKESKLTSVMVVNNDQGKWIGHLSQTLGYYESCHARDKISDMGKEGFTKMMQKVYGNELTMEQPSYDSLNTFEQPLSIQYDFTMNKEEGDLLYVNPMFAEGQKENPFKSAERLYPVEMPYTSDETFVLTMEVPKGYVVDELPKSVKVKLNQEDEGSFEYMVSQSGDLISLRSRLRFTRATFTPDEYELLREFYNLVVNKHNEQIVFKKKK